MVTKEQHIPEGWSVKKLGECFCILKTSNYSRAETQNSGGIYYIHYGDIHTKYPLHTSPVNINLFITEDKASRFDIIKNGDLILLDASEDYVGATKCIEITNIINEKIISGLHTIALRDRGENFANLFKAYLLSMPFVKNNFLRQITGIKVYGISKTNLQKIDLLIPSLPEQKKIAEILGVWDDGIEKLSKLVEEKKKLKKGMMQRLLTGNQRLKGFSEPWKEVQLGNIAKIRKGEQLNKLNMISYGFPVFNGGTILSGYTNNYNTQAHTIIISEGGNSCGFINYITENFWAGGHCYVLKEISTQREFLYNFLKFNEYFIMKLRVGSGLPNIQKEAIEKFKLFIPISLTEQKAIADILSKQDEEIDLLTKKLEMIKQQKKGLMQQLLTGKTRVKVN